MAMNGFGLALGYQAFQELKSGVEDVVTASSHFETTLNQVKQNTGLTTDQMGVMRQGVLDLSNASGVSTDLISQGWMHVMNVTQNAGDTTGILEVAMKSAVSTGGDVGKTADVLARAMHEYGLDVSTAADAQTRHNEVMANADSVMAVFHTAAQLSDQTLQQFSDNSARTIGVAAQFGISITDASAALATLAKHGFDSAGANVQVTDSILKMANPTKAAETELKKLSMTTGVDLVSAFSAAGLHQNGYIGNLELLHTALTSSSADQYEQAAVLVNLGLATADTAARIKGLGLDQANVTGETMKLIQAQRGGIGTAAELTVGWDDLLTISAKLKEAQAAGTVTQQAWNDTLKTTGEQWNILTTRLHNAAMTLGSELQPTLVPILTAMADKLPGALTASAKGVTTFAGEVKDGMVGALIQVQSTLINAANGMDDWAKHAGPAGTAVEQAIYGVQGLLLATQLLLQGDFSGAWNVAVQSMGNFGTSLDGVRNVAEGFLQSVADKLASTGAAWAPWAANAGQAGTVVSDAMSGVSGFVQALQLLLAGNFVGAWNTAGSAMGSFGAALGIIGGGLDVLRGHIGDVANAWGPVLGQAISAAGAGLNGLVGILGSVAGWLGTNAGAIATVAGAATAVLLPGILAVTGAWVLHNVQAGLAGAILVGQVLGSLITTSAAFYAQAAGIVLATGALAANAAAGALTAVSVLGLGGALTLAKLNFLEIVAGAVAATAAFVANAATTAIVTVATYGLEGALGIAALGFGGMAAAAVSAAAATILAMAPVMVPIALIAGAIGLLAVAWANDWGGIREITATAVGWIMDRIGDLIGGVMDIAAKLGLVGSDWRAGWDKFRADAGGALDTTKATVGNGMDAIVGLVQGKAPGIPLAIGSATAEAATLANGNMTRMQAETAGSTKGMIDSASINMELFRKNVDLPVASVAGSVATHMVDMQGNVHTVIDGMATDATTSLTSMKTDGTAQVAGMSTDVTAKTAAMQAGVTGAMSTMQTEASATMNAMASAILAAAQRASDQVYFIMSQMVTNVRSLASEAAAAGNAIGVALADGAAAGVQSRASAVAAAASSMVSTAVAAARAAAGAQSPSTVMAGLGGDMGDGLSQGIRGSSADVVSASRVLAAGADSAFADEIDAHSRSKKFVAHGANVAQSVADGINSKNPDVRAAARELARQAQIGIVEALPVGTFEIAGQDMGDGLSLGLLRGVDKAKSAADTYGNSILTEMQGFTQNVAKEIENTVNKLSDIQVKAGETIASALDTETTAIDAASLRAKDAIQKLNDNFSLNAVISKRKSDLQTIITDEERVHTQQAAADEAEFQHKLALSKAETTFHQQMEDAKTSKARDAVQQRYADTVANLNLSYNDAVAATKHRQELDAADRAFKAVEDKRMHDLDAQLAQDALARQIADLNAAKVKSVATSQETYQDAVQKAQLTADTQRQVLLRSYTQRLDDLKTAFLAKIPPLEGPAQEAFDAFMANIGAQTEAMGKSIADSMGGATTAAHQALAVAIPYAFNVTDKALDDAAAKSQSVMDTGGVIPVAAAATTTAISQIAKTHTETLTPALDAAQTAAGDLVTKGLDPLGAAAGSTAKDVATQISFVLQQLSDKMPTLIGGIKDFIGQLIAIPRHVDIDIVTHYSSTGSGGGGGSGGGSGSGSGAGDGSGSGGGGGNGPGDGSSGPGGKYNDPTTGHPYTHAAGGVTTGPISGIFGENGPEAIIPLGDYFVSQKSANAGGSAKLTREDARMIAEELAHVLQNVNLSVAVDDIHSSLLRKARRGGTLGLA